MDEPPPSQKHLFLSDAHLGGFTDQENSKIETCLIRLVDYCQANEIKIHLLGDLFDYWMEYPGHHPNLAAGLRDRFEEYNRRFGPTLYITGNHDNWTRDYFGDIGFEVVHDYKKITLDGKRFLLLHGDGIIDREGRISRPLLHRLLRNRRFVRLYQALLPPVAGLWVMKQFSRINRYIGEWQGTETTRLDRWAEKQLKETDSDVIICGHDHEPRKRKFHFGTYINLGNFYRDRTVAVYNNDSPELVFWNDGSRQLDAFSEPAITR
ncbi:MAG: metallophosphoesterase family protein [Balneolaceae bacterium]|nr:metallophosphoesterase family protein [Balneolaceae bacterium]